MYNKGHLCTYSRCTLGQENHLSFLPVSFDDSLSVWG